MAAKKGVKPGTALKGPKSKNKKSDMVANRASAMKDKLAAKAEKLAAKAELVKAQKALKVAESSAAAAAKVAAARIAKLEKSNAGDSSTTAGRAKYIAHPDFPANLRAEWRTFVRSHKMWARQEFNQKSMLLGMLEKMPRDVLSMVHAHNEEVGSVAEVMTILTKHYAGNLLLQQKGDTEDYENYTRTSETMADFLVILSGKRARALRSGMISDNESGGYKLLAKANVSQAEYDGILANINIKRELLAEIGNVDVSDQLPSYTEIEGALEKIVFSNELHSQRTGKKQNVATGGVQKQVKKRKKKAAKPAGKTPKVVAAGTQQNGGGQNNGANPPRVPDWVCNCGNVVFGSKTVCGMCSTPKPANAPPGVVTKGGGKGKGAGKGKGGGGGGKAAPAAAVPTPTPPTPATQPGPADAAKKKSVCRHFQQYGKCGFGEKCHFKHGG